MPTQRQTILSAIKSAQASVSAKKKQIRTTKKKTKFAGVTIEAQFAVGRLGIKPFRARRKAERRQGFTDLGIFEGDLIGLSSVLSTRKQDLIDFDNRELMI